MNSNSATNHGINYLNQLAGERLYAALFQCCSSSRFASHMVAAAPFADFAQMVDEARAAESLMSSEDWLEAFSHHPRIGDKAALAKKMEGAEQSGMQKATTDIVDRMYAANAQYEERFGHIYLVCATGKSAEELLSILEQRLDNDPADEFRIACEEQQKITDLRLRNLVDSSS